MRFFKKREAKTEPGLSLMDKWRLLKLIKDPNMLDKLKSRKLWITVGVSALTVLLSQLGLDPGLQEKLISLAMTYLGAQGLVDAAATFKNPA